MRELAGLIAGIVMLTGASPVLAENAVRVQSMNYPAWLVRNYQSLPLSPGFPLRKNDLVRTGEGGRVRLLLADGKALNLGESSRLVIRNTAEGSAASYALQSLRGVFRITSATRALASRSHTLEIGIGEISASIDNASIWGRAGLAQDAVCLVDGKMSVQVEAASKVDMTRALSCFVKPKGQAPLPVDLIDIQQHRLWMAETEIRDDAGIADENGQWQLVLISLTDAGSANRTLTMFRQQGFAARDKTVVRGERILHRLLLPGFVSIDAALHARARVERALGLSETWVWKASEE